MYLNEIHQKGTKAESEHTFVPHIDFKNDFDKVVFNKLFDKFSLFGFKRKELQLLAGYLSETKHCVIVKTVEHNFKKKTSGVPQVSIFRPLMLFVYVNNLPQAVHKFSSDGCAKDLNFLMEKSGEATDVIRQVDIRSSENQMSINWDKSKILCLKRPISCHSANRILHIVTIQKDVRVILSRNLFWTEKLLQKKSENLFNQSSLWKETAPETQL